MEIFPFDPRGPDLIVHGKPSLMRRPHGVIIIGGIECAHTAQCGHCGGHFIMVKGSGKRRGWCTNCCRVTCGSQECHECVPFEKRLEQAEKASVLVR